MSRTPGIGARRIRTVVVVAALHVGGALAASAPIAPAIRPCDVALNVEDPDPAGPNIREAPRRDARIVSALKPAGEWITVHVTGQSGDWARIDRAVAVDDAAESGERTVFRGAGWVHLRLLGIGSLFVGGGTELRSAPMPDAPVVFRLGSDDAQSVRVLACSGDYIRVRYGERIGWTRHWCNNERTSCN